MAVISYSQIPTSLSKERRILLLSGTIDPDTFEEFQFWIYNYVIYQKNINLEILRGLDVICPPVELQNKFEKIIEQLNLVKSSNSNFVADNLFQTLIQKAFKGELVAE